LLQGVHVVINVQQAAILGPILHCFKRVFLLAKFPLLNVFERDEPGVERLRLLVLVCKQMQLPIALSKNPCNALYS
jgi:hypothetical protein